MSLPSTEIQRVVLMVLLGIVGYLLVYNWNQDYGPGAGKPAVAPAPSPVADDAPPVAAPSATDAVPTADDDIPSDELSGTADAPASVAGADVNMASSRFVIVRTPTLAVWIDRLGGDIVQLELPKYPRELESDESVRLLTQSRSHVYVAQSGLIGRDGWDKSSASRPFYEVVGSARNEYVVDEGALDLTLRHRMDEVTVEKRFRFDAESYVVTVTHVVDNRANVDYRARLFAQLKRDASRPDADGFGMGPRPYVGAAFTTAESRYEKIDFDDLDDGPFRADVLGGWAAMLQHYFLVAWVGDANEVNAYNGRRLGDGNYAVGYIGPEVVAAPGEQRTVSARLYAGPKIQKRLEEVAPNLYLTVDYGLLWWLSVPLFYVLDAIHSVVDNWGVAIILLTVVVKILLFPLASAGFRSMARMKKLTPADAAPARALRERSPEAVAGDDGSLPQGGCQSVERLPALDLADASVLRAVLGALRERRTQAGALHLLDQGLGGVGSLAGAALPLRRVVLRDAADAAAASRSHAGKSHEGDADSLHRAVRVLPGWLGALLAGEQHPLFGTAVVHHSPDRKEGANPIVEPLGDTIAAVATPSGRGGIGIVRVSGPAVGRIARAVVRRPADA